MNFNRFLSKNVPLLNKIVKMLPNVLMNEQIIIFWADKNDKENHKMRVEKMFNPMS